MSIHPLGHFRLNNAQRPLKQAGDPKLQQVQAESAHAARVSMLGELTASIAHEVAQPLAAISINGQAGLRWLERPNPDLAEVKALLCAMVADANRAAEIVSRVRGMAIRRAPERRPLSIDHVVRDALLFLRGEIQSHRVFVLHKPAPSAPLVLGDQTQLQQVVVNLIINAIQAMTQAGSQRRQIVISTTVQDFGTLRCTIDDSGPGIKPEHLARLFESFFSTKEGGMGMGLSICRSIIEAHEGSITAEGKGIDSGVRFSFTLPTTVVPQQDRLPRPILMRAVDEPSEPFEEIGHEIRTVSPEPNRCL